MPEGTSKNVADIKGLRFFTAGLFLLLQAMFSHALAGDGIYMEPAEFLQQAFDGEIPEPKLVWLTGMRGDAAAEILEHKPASLRVRYWRDGDRTAWILEEIGREKPITAGFVIEYGKLRMTQVLAFRESRGWEIRHEFFTEQFKGVKLTPENQLSKHIDNITGATMSVSAMRRMAELALYLDGEVRNVSP